MAPASSRSPPDAPTVRSSRPSRLWSSSVTAAPKRSPGSRGPAPREWPGRGCGCRFGASRWPAPWTTVARAGRPVLEIGTDHQVGPPVTVEIPTAGGSPNRSVGSSLPGIPGELWASVSRRATARLPPERRSWSRSTCPGSSSCAAGTPTAISSSEAGDP